MLFNTIHEIQKYLELKKIEINYIEKCFNKKKFSILKI